MLLCSLTRSTRKPESCQSRVLVALSLSFGALTLALSAALIALPAISNYLLRNDSALRSLLPGSGTQRVSCEAPQITQDNQS